MSRMKQLSNDSAYSHITHRRIRGDLIVVLTHSLLEFPKESTFTHTTHPELRGHTFKVHMQGISACTHSVFAQFPF